MVGTGVPLLFRFYFLAETNLTGERPFHTRKQTSPDNAKTRQPTTQIGEDSEVIMGKKVKVLIAFVLVAVCVLAGAFFGRDAIAKLFDSKPTLTNTVVAKQLEKIQDLTTAKETDFGFEKYEDGGIALVTKKSFTMFYSYEARAGIDLGKADIDVNDDTKTISITLPAPTIQSVSVNPDTLQFFDQKSSLLNSSEVGDAATALQDAKKSAEKKLNKGELLTTANEQAKDVIERMYAPIAETDGYTVTVKTTDAK